MSIGFFAAQAMVVAGAPPDPGGDCDDYTRPSPTAVTTDLDAEIAGGPTTFPVETNLCSEII